MKQANQLALSYANELSSIRKAQASLSQPLDDDELLHVQTTGASLTELYESIRNASQNSEENLQLMHAINRYIERFFAVSNKNQLKDAGEILITDLTMAGYLANDSIHTSTVDRITDLLKQGVTLKKRLQKSYSKAQIERWVIQPLAARIENILRNHAKEQALANLAFNYFLSAIDIEKLAGERPATYEAILYMAVQKALLGSEEASIRLNLMDRYGVIPAQYATARHSRASS